MEISLHQLSKPEHRTGTEGGFFVFPNDYNINIFYSRVAPHAFAAEASASGRYV
jgi:hypothetical protein